MPAVASAAATLYRVNVPTSTRNSLTNVDRPGSDRPDRLATRNSPASTGATFSSTPTSSTAAPGWAAVAASGSQVWNGHSGALIANATKKPRNSHFCTAGLSGTWTSVLNRNVPVCPVDPDLAAST